MSHLSSVVEEGRTYRWCLQLRLLSCLRKRRCWWHTFCTFLTFNRRTYRWDLLLNARSKGLKSFADFISAARFFYRRLLLAVALDPLERIRLERIHVAISGSDRWTLRWFSLVDVWFAHRRGHHRILIVTIPYRRALDRVSTAVHRVNSPFESRSFLTLVSSLRLQGWLSVFFSILGMFS